MSETVSGDKPLELHRLNGIASGYEEHLATQWEIQAMARELLALRRPEAAAGDVNHARLIMERASSWFDIQGVAHTGELSAKAKSIRDDMRRWLSTPSASQDVQAQGEVATVVRELIHINGLIRAEAKLNLGDVEFIERAIALLQRQPSEAQMTTSEGTPKASKHDRHWPSCGLFGGDAHKRGADVCDCGAFERDQLWHKYALPDRAGMAIGFSQFKHLIQEVRDALSTTSPDVVKPREPKGEGEGLTPEKLANRTTIRIEVLRALFEYAIKDEQFPIDEPFNSYLRETIAALSQNVQAWSDSRVPMFIDVGWPSSMPPLRLDRPNDRPKGEGELRAALGCHAFASSDKHLSGYRLTLGFDTLEQVQDAHKAVVDIGKQLRAAKEA